MNVAFARWIRVVTLACVVVAVVTLVAVLDDGTSAYVLSALGVFLVIALGTPIALMHTGHVPRRTGM